MNASNAADSDYYEKILKDFSSKFIASIGSEGSLRGCLIPEAMALFDADWPRKKHDQYMKELGCTDQTGLLQKMDKGKIRLYLDEQSRWRVAVQKTEANAEELNHIDSAILRKKCGLRPGRSGNTIPPVRHPQTLFAMDEYKKGKISYDELTAIATASGTSLAGQQCPIPLRGANATPMPLNNVRAAGRNHQNGMNAFASSFVPSSSFSARNHQNGMNGFANSSFVPSSSFSVSTGMQSTKHRPTSFNRNEMLSLRRPSNITKIYIDHDQPRMNGHMATNGVHQRTNKFGLSGNEPATPMMPRLTYDPKEHSYFTASTRMYKNQLDSIKAEKSNEEMKKAATLASSNGNGGMSSSNGSGGTTTSSSGSGGMTNLTNNLANISINDDREDEDAEKQNAINESLLAPIDDDDF